MTGAKPTVEVCMPKLGDTVVEGTLVEWLVQPGARIAEGDLLVEITTDKVSTEYPSEIAGTLVEILVEEGETVPVGTPIARLTAENAPTAADSATPAPPAPTGEPAQTPPASAQPPTTATGTAVSGASPFASEPTLSVPTEPAASGEPPSVVEPTPAAPTRSSAVPHSEVESPPTAADGTAGPGVAPSVVDQTRPVSAGAPDARDASALSPDRPRATGAARAAAAAAGVDPTALAGSGRHGRVREADVQRSQRTAAQPAAGDAARPARTAAGAGARAGAGAAGGAGGAAAGAGTAGAGTAGAGAGAVRPAGGLSPMRRAIAEHMTRAWSGAPHAAVFGQADLTAVVELRARERARFRTRHGADLTALPFFVGALARALGGGDIGIAVALGEGLIVPVVRDADGPWDEVAARVADLVDRARRGGLRPDETGGGVSTITNLGVFDAQWSQPILNQGQATILGLGVSAVRPLAQPDGLKLAVTAPLSLVYSRHRLDEVEASALLGRITSELATPR